MEEPAIQVPALVYTVTIITKEIGARYTRTLVILFLVPRTSPCVQRVCVLRKTPARPLRAQIKGAEHARTGFARAATNIFRVIDARFTLIPVSNIPSCAKTVALAQRIAQGMLSAIVPLNFPGTFATLIIAVMAYPVAIVDSVQLAYASATKGFRALIALKTEDATPCSARTVAFAMRARARAPMAWEA